MPLLPRKNNLDYQPDNIIQASKQLTTIALENMKNPLTDPDQPALSALSSQKSLSGSMDEFSKLLLGLQSSFIKAKQEGARIVGIFLRQQGARQGADQMRQRQEQMDDFGVRMNERMNQAEELQRQINEEQARLRGEGRPKGSKNKNKKASTQTSPQAPSTLLQIEDAPPQQQSPNIRTFFGNPRPVRRRLVIEDDDETPTPPPSRPPSQQLSQPVRRVSAEPVGRFGVLPVADYSRRMISQGAVADSFIEDPDSTNTESSMPSYNNNDDESSQSSIPSWYNPSDRSSSSGNSSSSNRYRYGGDGDDWDDGDGDDTNSSHYSNGGAPKEVFYDANPNTVLSSLILDITRQIRYMDLLVISRIKPAVQQLNPSQLNTLSQAYATLTELWNTFSVITLNNLDFSLVDYFKDVVNFGDQIIKILEEELNKLKIDLLIVVNSYKQNEAIQPPNFTPNSFWENSAVREMEGAGRTFTGRNHSGRDIPTIWRGAQRECAYKYML